METPSEVEKDERDDLFETEVKLETRIQIA
jgi:hypothetical protein